MTLHTRLVVAAGLVWLEPNRILVQRRPATAPHGGGCLELPGGKVEPGESPVAALRRELLEEWGPGASQLRVEGIAEVLHHLYPDGPEILLCIYHVDAGAWRDDWEARVRVEPGASVEAHALQALPAHEFLAADRPFIEDLARGSTRSRSAPRSGC
jgi:mutator protein MutT